jgi:hypothetical protein
VVSDRELARVRAAGRRGDGQQGRQLRAARTGHGRHEGGRPLPDLRVRRRARAVHGQRAGVLEELLRVHRAQRPVRALAGLEVRRSRARQPRAAGDPARRVQDQDLGRVDPARRAEELPGRTREHPEDDRQRPAVQAPLPALPARAARRGHAALPGQVPGRDAARADQGANTRRRCCAPSWATTHAASRPCARRGPSERNSCRGRCRSGSKGLRRLDCRARTGTVLEDP